MLAGGLDPTWTLDGGSFHPAYVGQVGFEWRDPERSLGFRLGLFGLYKKTELEPSTGGSSHKNVLGLDAGVLYALYRDGIRPYAIGGVGVYRTWSSQELFASADRMTTYRDAALVLGASGGLGLAVPVSAGEFFLEGRTLFFSSGRPIDAVLPVQLGWRF